MSTPADGIKTLATQLPPGSVKHRSIYEALQASIVDGYFRAGERLPTEDELVRTFGVSRTTVSRAMRDLQYAGLLERRRGAGSYVVGAASNNGATLVGVVIAMQLGSHSIFTNILQTIERAAHVLGWQAVASQPSHTTLRPEEKAKRHVENLVRRRVRGVAFAPGGHSAHEDRFNLAFVEACNRAGMALVLLDRDVAAFPHRSTCDLVCVDNLLGAYTLTEHLLSAGCRRILFALELAKYSSTDARLAGRDLALRDAGHTVDAQLTVRFASTDMEEVVNRVRESKPDAVICDNDQHAANLLPSLAAAGIRVPDDVLLAGFDDNPIATLVTPALTTYRQPVDEIGMEVMRLLESRIKRPHKPSRRVLIPGELVVRKSTMRATRN